MREILHLRRPVVKLWYLDIYNNIKYLFALS